jgi:hypothetical protein
VSRGSFGLVLAILLLLSGNAFADQFYFTSSGSVTWNNVYVTPYQANDNTHPQNNPLTIYCDDWNTEFSGNPTWNANIYALTAGNVGNFKYGNTTQNYDVDINPSASGDYLSVYSSSIPDAFDRYLEAAWLDEQWQNAVIGGTSTTTMQIGIAAAMWTLFVDSSNVGGPLSDPTSGLIGAINSTGYADAVYGYLKAAQAKVAGGYTAAGWDVIVPEGNSFPMQEFLVHDFSGDTSVPEPSAIILLGTVAGLLGGLRFRRKGHA